MTESSAHPQPIDEPAAAPDVADAPAPGVTPLCVVIDEQSSIRHFVSLIMQGSGVDTLEFPDSASFRTAVMSRPPDIIFLNVTLDAADVIQSITALGKRNYRGAVQLMSNRGSAVLENVKNIGEQQKLNMRPVLKKPFETAAIQKIIDEMKIGTPRAAAARIGLDEALKNGWIEFWYQPKIDLRKKQLAGAEAFARARHPEFGVLSPGAFMPGADEASVLKLSEQAIIAAIKAGMNFAKVGVNLKISVNIAIDALVKLPIPEIVRAHRPSLAGWPGMIIDVTEEQIVTDIALATDITKKLEQFNIKLAIDDFGRGYSSLIRLKELPFAEMKLDRSFVTDCGTDKVNAPICKTVIDLAHNFGSLAVAIGIEKAADVLALVSMGCDYGQGFLLGQPMPEERFMSLLKQRAGHQPKIAEKQRA
jgi:EAL domain-containing protein (putative c-di-GMP-specific phosphodiesterase class I)